MKADKVVSAIKEILDIVKLATDETANGEQVAGFMKETVEAEGALFSLATDLEKDEYGKAAGLVAGVTGATIAAEHLVFSDGSSVKITVEAVTGPTAPPA